MSAFTLARINALDRRVSSALVRLLDGAPVEVLAERLFVVIEGHADIDATATALANAALAAVLPDAVAAAHAAAAASSAAAASAAATLRGADGAAATASPLTPSTLTPSPLTPSLIKRRSSTTRVASVVALIARFRDAYRYVVETYVSDGLAALAAGTAAFDSFMSSQHHSVARSLLSRLDVAADGAADGTSAAGAATVAPAAADSATGDGCGSTPTTPPRARFAAPGVLVPPATPELRARRTSTPVAAPPRAAAAATDAARRELARLGVAAAALCSSASEGVYSAPSSAAAWDAALDERLILLIDRRMRDPQDA